MLLDKIIFGFCCCILTTGAQLDTGTDQSRGFGPWSLWSVCPVSCDILLSSRTRSCQHSVTSNNYQRDQKRSCVGVRKQYRLCNSTACAKSRNNHRKTECDRQTHVQFRGRYYHWQPYVNKLKTCEVYCKATGYGFYSGFGRILKDGVSCSGVGTSGVCLHGRCQTKLAGAMRSSVNRNTGYTANKLMLGREVNTPAHVMFPQRKGQDDADDYVAKLTGQMQRAHDTARSTLKTSLKRMKKNYDLRTLERQYEEGDIVYLLDSATLKGKCKKLCSPWKGPAIVVKKLSAFLFRVKLRKAFFVVNHDRLKPCNDRELPAWIKQWQDSPAEVDPSETEDKTLYCLCRKPWQGRFMIQCDYCDEWYHGSCVDITATDAMDINKYKCVTCKAR